MSQSTELSDSLQNHHHKLPQSTNQISVSRKSKRMFCSQPQSFLLKTLIRSQHVLPLCFFLLFFCYLPTSVELDEEGTPWDWEPDQYPNLRHRPKLCTGFARNPPSSICDPDQQLTSKEAHALDKLISSEANITTCICTPCPQNKKGLIVKVAILNMFKSRPNQTQDETIEQFTERTRTNWNFSPACQHDVLIFLSTGYNKVYISMGAKAERVIGSSDAKEIVKDTIGHIKYGNYYQGLESVIASINYRVQKYDPRFDRLGLKQGLTLTIGAGLISLVVIILAVWWCIRRETARSKKWANNGTSASNANNTNNSLDNNKTEYHLVKTGGA